jgi:hypothetical protein
MTEKPKKSFADKLAFEQQNSVPSAFASTVKEANKLGARKFTPTKQYIKPDISIGSRIAGKDSDLEGLGDVVNKVKKEHVEIGSGAIRKFKMTKQLSGRFSQEARKEEAMEMHKQKQEEAKMKKEEDEAMANMPLAERRAYEARKRAAAVTTSSRNNATLLSPRLKLGRNKSGLSSRPRIGRKKSGDILALVDDAIENDPTEEAKKKAAALKAAADAPILPPPKKSPQKKKRESEKLNVLVIVDAPTPIEEAAAAPPKVEAVPSLFSSAPKAEVKVSPAPKKEVTPEPKEEPKAEPKTPTKSFTPTKSPKPRVAPPKVEAVPSLSSSAPKAEVKVSTAPKKEVTPEPKEEPKAEPKTPTKSFTHTKSPKPRVAPPKVEAVPSLSSSAPKEEVKVSPAPKKEVAPEPKEEPKAEPKTPINSFTPTKSPKPRVAPPMSDSSDDDSDSSTVEVQSDDDSDSSPVEVQSSLDFGKALLSPNGHENTMLSPNGYRKAVKTFKLATAKPRPSIDIEKDKETPYVYDSIYDSNTAEELRTRLAEVERRLESCRIDGAVELEALKKKIVSEKIQLSKEFGQQYRRHKIVNEKQAKTDQKAVDEEKNIVDKLREENKRLRATVEKYPYQMAEVMASSESLERANEEVAGHFKKLNEFTKKLQADHDRLEESNSQCRDKYLPRYRQELYERKKFSEGETKIKVLYRDCMLKIAKRFEKSRQPQLWEDINTLVIETEMGVNPKFDPRHLFAAESDSDSSSSDSSSSDDSDSDSD